MGNTYSNKIQSIFCRPKIKIVFVGEESTGRTTALYHLKLGKVVDTVPTVGNNIEVVQFEDFIVQIWDLGGLCKVKPFWNRYYEDADGIVFFYDLSNQDQTFIQSSRQLLASIKANPHLMNVPLLVIGNKTDIAMTTLDEMIGYLSLEEHSQNIKIVGACSITGEGLREGLKWICNRDKIQN